HLGALEGLLRSFDWAQTHELGFERGQPGRDHARKRLNAQLLGPALRHHHHRRGAVVQRAGVAGRDRAVFAESGLERCQHLDRGARPRAVVLREHLAVGQRNRNDLAIEEAVIARLDGGVLALHRIAILLLAADLLAPRPVLGRLAHRYVDVGILRGIPGREPRVVGVGSIRIAAAVARYTLHADGQEDVALAGLDG